MTIEQILSDVFSISELKINDDLELWQIPLWDSMSHMMLILQIEEKYKVELTGDEIADLRSVRHIRELLQKRNVPI
jgi:acyl carrier protein